MSVSGRVWRYSFDVPAIDGIHAAANAFCRTSQHGVWTLDAEKASDAYVLYYLRGSWSPPPAKTAHFFYGAVSSSYEQFALSRWDGWRIAPMTLSVAFRPSPARNLVTISLEYQLAGPNPSLLYEAAASRLARCIHEETESLARYLRDNLSLPTLPTIDSF